jgi:hypothetical protein
MAFTGSATDSSSTATLSYAWNFGDGTTATGVNASHAFANAGTTAVARAVTFTATDSTGVSASASRTITVNPAADAQPPALSVSEVGSTGTITFHATASDNTGVTKVEFYVDGNLAGSSATVPYALSIDSTTLTSATHTLTGKAYDAAGNVGTSSPVSFAVSNTPPTVAYAEVEPNNTQTTANAVSDTVTQIVGYLNSASDNDDWFTVKLPAGRTLTLDMTGPAASQQVYYLYLYNGSTQVAKSTNASTTQSPADRVGVPGEDWDEL